MEIRLQISKGGRLVLPSKMRKALNLKSGDEIVLRLENDSLRLIPLDHGVKMAQKTVRQYVPPGSSLVDDLIKARQEEAANE